MTWIHDIRTGALPGYRRTESVDVSAADYEPEEGACHIYASGDGDVVYRALTASADSTATIPSGGGMVRLGDSMPIIIVAVRTAGTTATGIVAGIL